MLRETLSPAGLTRYHLSLDIIRFLGSLVRSRSALTAENLFLRKQLALYQERQVRPRRATDATRLTDRSQKWQAPILDAPAGRRDEFVDRYFKRAKADQVVCILKAREPARILTAIGSQKENRWHLELKQRWVEQYNFYFNDGEWGRMFVRVCPYFPFSARLCLNQRHWLANRLRQRGIRFEQPGNAFLNGSDPKILQKLADSLTAQDVISLR